MSTSVSKFQGVLDKQSKHPLAALILGRVVGAYMLGDSVIIYYEDGHKVLWHVDDVGDICIHEHEVPTC